MGWITDRLVERPLQKMRQRRPHVLDAHRRALYQTLVRDRVRPVYLGDNTVLCTVLGRYKMYLDSRDLSIAAHLITDGLWEMWVTEVLVTLLRRPMVAVDAGANLGYFSLIMGDLCMFGQVHAFEPNPSVLPYLRRTLAVNDCGKRVTVHPTALGDVDGRELHLVADNEWVGGGHLVEQHAVAGRPTTILRTRRLDGIESARDAEIVKIDAEGSEPAVWRGMAGMIAGTRLHIVLLEFAPIRYADPAAFLAEIVAAGFALAFIHETRGVVETTAEVILADKARLEWMLLLRR